MTSESRGRMVSQQVNKETTIQNAIVDYLHTKHIPVWRISETANIIGFPDLLCINPKNGMFIGIEVKTPRGQVSSVQEIVHRIIRDANAQVLVARSLEDVVTFFEYQT